MKRDVLKTLFPVDEIPRFPCPHCEGRLRLTGDVRIHRSAATAWIATQAWSDLAQVEDEFHAALQSNPNDPRAAFELGTLYVKANKNAEA